MKVLITRPINESTELAIKLKLAGIVAWPLTIFKFLPGQELFNLDYAFKIIKKNDIICVTSKKAIEYSTIHCSKYQLTWPSISQYYAIGPGTAQLLYYKIGYIAQHPTCIFNSESLLKLINLKKIKNKIILILQGDHGRMILENTLKKHGARVIKITCYQRYRIKKYSNTEILKWKHRKINTLVITSMSTLKAIYNIFSINKQETWFLKCKLLVVGHRLKKYAQQLGWKNIFISNSANNKCLFQMLTMIKSLSNEI
ncbi:MAG: uroporphyrinogen-III synthase [Buchnera aphidicola (Eriosoma harunire)]